MGHLVIEKLLKAHYVRLTGHPAIMTHDLLKLSDKAGLSLPPQFAEWLDEITTFNINTRYDSYKQDFYRLCTNEFTDKWIKRIEEIRVWLIQQ
jgi:HEPN domain-containing protein